MALVAGNRALVQEAADVLGPEIEVVAVKDGASRFTATCLPLARTRGQIREGTSRAFAKAGALQPFVR